MTGVVMIFVDIKSVDFNGVLRESMLDLMNQVFVMF